MKENKLTIIRLALSAVLFVTAIFVPLKWLQITIYVLSYLIAAYDILWRAAKNIARGQVFDENFLMAIASIGAFAIGEYPEAVAVVLFYQVGELFQKVAVDRSRKSVKALMDIRPDRAVVLNENGEFAEIAAEDVKVGDTVLIKAGERVSVDGVIIEGKTALNTAALTGESYPRSAVEGDTVLSGSVNIDGVIKIRATKDFYSSTASKILDLVENATASKAKTENFITKFARYYTPAVVAAAILLAVVSPLFTDYDFTKWIYRALSFLVVSCPCALVISVPLGFFGGIGGASKRGILIKGGGYMETLSKAQTVVFDKTGTLTKGEFSVTKVTAVDGDENALIALAAKVESKSNHPLAKAILKASGKVDTDKVSDISEIAGRGLSAVVDGVKVYCGNRRLMEEQGIEVDAAETDTVIHVCADGKYKGSIEIADRPKENAKEALAALKKSGVARIVMLTGDNAAAADKTASELGIDEVHSGLLPENKITELEKILADKPKNGTVCFVGDGINDAPVLARADVGIAMGALGSDAAIEAADVVLMNDDLTRLSESVEISRRTLDIVRQNIILALAVKLAVLILASFGVVGMWGAVFADVGVSVIAILNAMRSLKADKKLEKKTKLVKDEA